MGTSMVKKKTSIMIDDALWTKWIMFVVKKHGTSRKASEELEQALIEYMQKHGG
ncbi:MAG: hypothetical protein RMJ15_05055 [Nitrososphaerota archaeon]|nr:hypothetical protein [Candidatus Bathyarchaeota archaeon]MDW8023088.1 hypothetical protein [Nitrososphaerota archaeon]